MKILMTLAVFTFYTTLALNTVTIKWNNDTVITENKDLPLADQKIQVALLLDTSNSMDGLIEQAKSRLWNIVNTLATLKYEGKSPTIEIALYEYGNERLSQKENYVKQITPLTTDLDWISEKLFALKTNGGNEYCGAVIKHAQESLDWNDGKHDIKLIYIAGNEPFNQGPIHYTESIAEAVSNNIYVNTILCGHGGESIGWKKAASLGQGKLFIIDSDKEIVYIDTPFDDAIGELNIRLNSTYISYGIYGEDKKQNQFTQDTNAKSKGQGNMVERTISKSKNVYSNADWDIVDQYKEDEKIVLKLEKKDLPQELQNKTNDELKIAIEAKIKERKAIQEEINTLSKKRQSYIDQNMRDNTQDNDLGIAMKKSILDLATKLGYRIEE